MASIQGQPGLNSYTTVCYPLVQTCLVQFQGGLFLSCRTRQSVQVLCLLYVIFQSFIQTDVLLKHRARGIVQLPI